MSDQFGMPIVECRTSKELLDEIASLKKQLAQAEINAALTEDELLEEIKELRAALVEAVNALGEITTDYADRFDMDSPSTNPGIKYCVSQSRKTLTRCREVLNAPR